MSSGPITSGQSAVVLHVGTQIIPIGESWQVQPSEPGGHASAQSASSLQGSGPIMPPPAPGPVGIIPPVPGPGAAPAAPPPAPGPSPPSDEPPAAAAPAGTPPAPAPWPPAPSS